MTFFDTKSSDPEVMTAFYDRTHPEYRGLLDHWRFCRQTYAGGPTWFQENIFRYLKEGDEEFRGRIERAYRPNHTREVVELIQKYIFKSPVKRDASAPEGVKKFWRSATRAGQSIDELMAEVSSGSSIGQRVALVIDAASRRNEEGKALSLAEAEEETLPIYGYVVLPENILDYSWNKTDGALNWIKLREFVRDDDGPLSTGNVVEQVRLWTRTHWHLYTRRLMDDDKTLRVEMTEEGEHDLGEVPVLLIDHQATSNPYKATGLIDDIVYLDRAHANYLSNLDAIIQDQTFSQLAIPAEALPADQQGAKSNMREMGTKRIFTYHAGVGSSARPEFLSPDPKQAGVILSVINKIISEIYNSIGLGGERTKQDNAVGIDNSSGVAKAYDFERINSLLLMKAKRLERAENWAAKIVTLWAGETPPAEGVDLVTYPNSFDVATLGDELVTAEALLKVKAPIEIRREQMKEIVLKLMPHVSDEAWKKLMDAVDAWEDIEVEAFKSDVEMKAKAAETASKAADKAVAAPSRQGSVTKATPTTKAQGK